ncbi:MAG: AmmeMemoRadiSam system protein B [Methanomassiliicoccaceae archaeon]|jgi:AmmeMemoRadiSam system protein B|nr:AmmeMemoRadiSam system protein B [Methanomassiliicoccaceae archaeon]
MRYPAVAGRFYPNDKKALMKEMESCFSHAIGPGMPGRCSNERKITAVIAPHAGYRASGMNAAHAYKEIAEDGLPEVYIIVGPDHHGIPYDAAMCSDPYITPLGECGVHSDIAKKLRKLMPDDAHSHKYEHSVEVQVPFIQFIDPGAKMIPIIMSDQSQECVKYVAEAIAEACDGHDYLIVASSDLSHYVPKSRASSEGKDVLDRVCSLDVPGMYEIIERRRITSCGFGPMAVAMSSKCSSAKLLRYSDSHDSLGGSEVVAYASVAFYK